jgi:hypothetical protein
MIFLPQLHAGHLAALAHGFGQKQGGDADKGAQLQTRS